MDKGYDSMHHCSSVLRLHVLYIISLVQIGQLLAKMTAL